MRLEREVPLVAPADQAWRALAVLPPARGSAAGYEGTAVLEDADDEARTATLRVHGALGAATVAATAAVTVLEERLAITAVVRSGLGGAAIDEATAEDALGHLATTLAYALATAGGARSAIPAPAVASQPAPALVPAGPSEVITPRPRDVLQPGQAPPGPEDDRSRWVRRVGVAAAAGLAVLGIIRGRR
ncbi:hypothetical protein [Candidatus Solirubrobacter pratensis]|uniref:hypothetical protein n=1 Tax=Candidatus Solirubrobacter pratensis TaxID=1298857 RepID=UPI0004097BBD|nr:hypothetical protein [Candidatus Solirubrobacter pratensis]